MKTTKKIAFWLLGGGLLLLIISIVIVLIGEYLYGWGDNKYTKEITDNVQRVVDSTTYFIEVFPFDSLEYHEIPTYYIYQDGHFRNYGRYNDNTIRTRQDGRGAFYLDTTRTEIRDIYSKAYELDVYLKNSGSTIFMDGQVNTFFNLDMLFWNKIDPLVTSGVGYYHIFDAHNVVQDTDLFSKDTTIVKNRHSDYLFWEYNVRPFRIFYKETDNINVIEDVRQAFDSIVTIFENNHKVQIQEGLDFNKILKDSLTYNKWYFINKRAWDYCYSLPLASYAFDFLDGMYIESYDFSDGIYIAPKEYQDYKEAVIWFMNDSLRWPKEPVEPIFRNNFQPNHNKYYEKGYNLKLDPMNMMSQYARYCSPKFDVYFVLTDCYEYHLDYVNRYRLDNVREGFDTAFGLTLIMALALLLASCILFAGYLYHKNS